MRLEPRLEPDEIAYFKDLMEAMPEGTQMTEWGSGGSTLMFLPYFTTGKLISIEHNVDWVGKVASACNEMADAGEIPKEVMGNAIYCFAPPMVAIDFYGYGVPFEENPTYAANYISPKVPDADIFASNIYFVDGICRGAILTTINMYAVSRDAIVLLHDYYGPENRAPWYEWAVSTYRKIEQVGTTMARLYL